MIAFLYIVGLSGCVTLSSCKTTKQSIMKAYLTDVSKTDGINREESMLLAQSELIFRGYESTFDIGEPKNWGEDREHYTYLFLHIGLTLIEARPDQRMVVTVSKKNGEVNLRG